MRGISKRFCKTALASIVTGGVVLTMGMQLATAAELVCEKVVAEVASGEGSNSALGSRVKCPKGEMLTGGTCYPEGRPDPDGSCQTSAMGIIQPIVEHPGTTEEAFFTCLQTGGTNCPVSARTRAMAICCKVVDAVPAAKKPAEAPAKP